MKLKKGDKVKIIAGKDRGKTGSVLRALPEDNKIIVEGLNTVNKRARPKKQGEKGQLIVVARPLQVSNVMLVCSACKEPTRIGFRIENGSKIRYCKKCKANT
jgi:large subunit ribosomal protein L24